MYTAVYTKVRINGNTHGEVMSDIGVTQGCPLCPTLFDVYIGELKTYLNKSNMGSLCLFNTMVAILLYVVDVLFYSLNLERAYKDI